MDKEQLERLYAQEEYYWGKEPSELARKLLTYMNGSAKMIIDLGAGEGRDSVFLAKQGWDVISVDIASAGLRKARKLAEEMGTALQTIQGDVNDFVFPCKVDALYSIGALQYIKPENRQRQFQHFKESTQKGGIHALFAFIDHPDIETAPDWGENEYLYIREELQAYYADWKQLYTEEIIFSCNSSDIPHRHAARILIVRKV
ncbi:class I SAM-dependent methyltransferase [Aneurinibacillus migulanus]|uniref:class I SAM-dependent methyltransferase n=1 Tax=Aneurinibacillus migulanus TaxID=47500 RepID=UPI002E206EF7|nr:class I SAM-dependent methyltransferase [Aneurinibacillus migulanus]